MTNMHTDLPKTINDALKILAYNDYFWEDPQKAHVKPHPKDKQTIVSLAESQYAWTEKQAKLALGIVKRYATKFESYGIEVRNLIKNPVYEHPFRVINSEKIIELSEDHEGNPTILMNLSLLQLERLPKRAKFCPHLLVSKA